MKPDLLKAELLLDYLERVLVIDADVGLGCLYQILQLSKCYIR